MNEQLRSVHQPVCKSGTRRLQDPFSSTEKKGGLGEASSAAPNDPPPAYMAAAPSASASSSTPVYTADNGDNDDNDDNDDDVDDADLAFLSKFDTVFLIDDSGSMARAGTDPLVGSRWDEVYHVLGQVAPTCTKYDADGIDIYFLNHESGKKPPPSGKKSWFRKAPPSSKARDGYYEICTPEDVDMIFQRAKPWGGTPTALRLHDIFAPYMKRLEAEDAGLIPVNTKKLKPMSLIVFTDGKPTDDPGPELNNVARRLDAMHALSCQIGVQFFQVGDDEDAKDALEKLDGDKKKKPDGVRDIVDTTTWDEREKKMGTVKLTLKGIMKVVLGAIDKKYDWTKL